MSAVYCVTYFGGGQRCRGFPWNLCMQKEFKGAISCFSTTPQHARAQSKTRLSASSLSLQTPTEWVKGSDVSVWRSKRVSVGRAQRLKLRYVMSLGCCTHPSFLPASLPPSLCPSFPGQEGRLLLLSVSLFEQGALVFRAVYTSIHTWRARNCWKAGVWIHIFSCNLFKWC